MNAPPSGQAERTSADHKQCGKLAAEAAMRGLGLAVRVAAPDNANAAQLVAAIRVSSPRATARAVFAPPSAVLPGALAAGEYVMVQVFCTSQAQPVPRARAKARHWVTAYDVVGDEYNPWNARTERVNLDAVYAPDGGCVIVGATPAPASQEESDVLIVNSAAGQWLLRGSRYDHIPVAALVGTLYAAGVRHADNADQLHAWLVSLESTPASAAAPGGDLAVSGTLHLG